MTARPLLPYIAAFLAVIPWIAGAEGGVPCYENGKIVKCASSPSTIKHPAGKISSGIGDQIDDPNGQPGSGNPAMAGAEGIIGGGIGGLTTDEGDGKNILTKDGDVAGSSGGKNKPLAGDTGRAVGGLGSGLGGDGTGGFGTEDTVPTAALRAELRKIAEGVQGRQKKVALLSAESVGADLAKTYPERAPAQSASTFRIALEIELEEKEAIRAARREGLSREELKNRIAAIEKASYERATKEIPPGPVADLFPTKFNEAWDIVRQEYRDQHEYPSGRPNRRRLDDLLRNGAEKPANWTLDAQDKLASGDKAGGRAALDKAIALGGSAESFALRGALRLDDKDYDGAYQDAKKALELNPGDKNAMGVLKTAEGRTSPGLASTPSLGAGRGSAGSAGGSGAYQNGGSGFSGFNPGRTRQIPGMTPASTLVSNQKLEEARRALAMGDAQAAIGLAQRAIELNPGNAEAYGFLSSVFARTGDYKRAIASANAGLALAPGDAALLNNKAFAENRSRLYREALGSSNGAIEADSRSAFAYANRAHAYGGLGDKEAMMSDINRAAGIDPRFEKAAADAAALQLPSNGDILFMFPGENPSEPAPAAPARTRSFGLVVGAGLAGGLLLALGLLSTVLAPLKDSVVSAFTKATRRGPAVHDLEEESTPAAPLAAAEPGLIRGQYEISRQIGAGGMGMVYEGTDRSLGRRVAIKKMREELRINPRERERFVIEAKTVASLHHPNIVDIYAIAEEGDDVYLVFEYVDGKTIHDLVQAKGRLNQSDAVRVTRAVSEALAYAHSRGVIHRDMKPSNVMATSAGTIKVMDFGIARMAKDALTRYSMTNTVVGTPPYMAPEQEQGVVRKESDVYALAICAYEMLTGKLPFIGIGAGMLMNKINMSYIPPSRSIAGLPEALDEVFLKAFQADPDNRFRTPQEFAAALDAALGGVRGKV